MLRQGRRTLLAAVLSVGLTTVGLCASADPSLAVPSAPAGGGSGFAGRGAGQGTCCGQGRQHVQLADLIGRLPGSGLAAASSLGG